MTWRVLFRQLVVLCCAVFVASCARYGSQRGVEVTWEEGVLDRFQRGVTTRSEVMAALGPPSQLVNLGDESVLYYLNEDAQGEGLILILYNRFEINTRYDRAVFIFDADDRLSDYAGYVAPEPAD